MTTPDPTTLHLDDSTRGLLHACGDALAGYPAVFLVGGFLRDALLGRLSRDVDLLVEGDARPVATALAAALDGSAVVLDEERGTVRVVLHTPRGTVRALDLVSAPAGLAADLARRDFTVDALAMPLTAVEDSTALLDPHSGLGDLRRGLLRPVSEVIFREDGLRVLRAFRLRAELRLLFTGELEELLRRDGARVADAAPERQRNELARLFATPRATAALREADALGVLSAVLPELNVMRGVSQPPEHHYDVFEHSLETVAALDILCGLEEPPFGRERWLYREVWEPLAWQEELRSYLAEEPVEGRPRVALLKLAALLHDAGKPATKAVEADGRTHFFGHAALGAEMTAAVARRLRFSEREVRFLTVLVAEHLRPTQLSQGEPPTARALYRFFRDTGEAALGVLLLSLADHAAARGPQLQRRDWRAHALFTAHVLGRRQEERAITHPPKLVDGHVLMAELGLAPGPLVGELLEAVREAQAAGEVRTREEALDLARRQLSAAAVTAWEETPPPQAEAG